MIYTDTVFYHKSEENPHDAPIIPSSLSFHLRVFLSLTYWHSFRMTMRQSVRDVREYGSVLKSPRWGNIMTDIITSPNSLEPRTPNIHRGAGGINGVRQGVEIMIMLIKISNCIVHIFVFSIGWPLLPNPDKYSEWSSRVR